MRYLCCYKHKNKEGNIIKKCEVLTTKTNNVYTGQYQLLIKLSADYNLPDDFVERDYSNENQVGIFYIEPKADNSPINLRDLDVDEELQRYEAFKESFNT